MEDDRHELGHDHVPDDKQRGHRRRIHRRRHRANVRSAAALAILAIWAASTIYDIGSAKYDPPDGLNTIALAAATYLFGSAFIQENRADKEEVELDNA